MRYVAILSEAIEAEKSNKPALGSRSTGSSLRESSNHRKGNPKAKSRKVKECVPV